ncbi:MAG TPA: isoleucine--tRNA ligase [Candidatus Saccharibacteria bacterium]|nr:isoleucine--tRNA ligase [Candidatus Saccharibacteria bacterium]
MKFKANTRRRAAEYEKDLVQQWKTNKTFEKSVEMRPIDNSYVFYDGPPFITGVPHHGTLLSSVIKDAVPRYQTMKGKRVERVWGWDSHGLPAENFVEKKLGIVSRHEVGEKISLEDYIITARDSMVSNAALWEDTIDRIGRWVDFKGAYKTMDKDYMESIWWAFSELYKKGKIYEGERVLMYDTKWATPLSKAEVTMDAGAYIEVTDPSVYVKFKLVDDEWENVDGKTPYLLAWTTTPWTLPGNTAVAVNPGVNYVEVKLGDEHLILAKDTLELALTDEKHNALDYQVIRSFKGKELVGKSYEPIFEHRGDNAHQIWAADYVTTESGTGIVHLAPAYGEEDFDLAREVGIPVVHVLDDYGKYSEGEWLGEDVWEINKTIAKTLLERGDVWKIDYIRHEYPHNPRTGNRLMYRAHPGWFMDIDGQRTEMLEQNSENINWFPDHIKHGRFEKTIQSAPDWNLSRDRFWATAMPVWKGIDVDGKEHIKVIGSYAELKKLSGVELEDYHRPWVDDIKFDIDGVHYERIDKVLDGWFESGSMPFAQFHYPFENVDKFERNFPGDFIVEYVGQVRAWFYYVHAVNVGLFGHNAFKNVIVTGNVAGNDGRKMSKSRGNYTDPNELMDQYSADSLRFLLLQSPLLNGEDFTLQDKEVGDVARKLGMIWNMYDFFTMYAEVDNWEWNGELTDPSADVTNPLDQWVISRVHQLTAEIEKNMDAYNIPDAMKPILPFIEDASNWYVRRSRRRFWKSGDDTDKNDAYRTLHYVLVRLSQILAPFTPFLAEELYINLTGGESVHLTDWPTAGRVNELVVNDMEQLRDYVNQGLSIRAKERIKVRQPLASVTIQTMGEFVDFAEILREELNVKDVLRGSEFGLDLEITPELRSEGLSREVIRHIQAARKDAGLNVDDRIKLSLTTDNNELKDAIKAHQQVITDETLATNLSDSADYEYSASVKVDGAELTVSLQKQS